MESVTTKLDSVTSGVETVKLCCLTLTTGPGTAFTHFQVPHRASQEQNRAKPALEADLLG